MNVYVIACDAGQVKVGVSDWPENRLKQLQRQMDAPLHLVHVFRCHRWTDAYELERRIHEALEDCALSGEWFRCIPEEAVMAGVIHR